MISAKMNYTEVTENIVSLRITGEEFNDGSVTCIALDDGLIFVDAGRKVERTKKFREEMEKKFNKKAKMMILTHFHWDHYLGVAAFNDIPIYASQKAFEDYTAREKKGHLTNEARAQYIQGMIAESKKGTFTLSEKWHSDWAPTLINAELYPIQYGIKDQIKFNDKDKEVIFKVIGGHTECSAYLLCPSEKVLIAGDNFNCHHAKNSICMLANMSMKGVEILKEFEKLDFSKVVPGHGPVVDKEYVTKTREYFEEMFSKLKELKDKGVPEEEAVKDTSLPEFFEEEKHERHDFIMSNWFKQL